MKEMFLRNARAGCYVGMGRHEDAHNLYVAALRVDPHSSTYYRDLIALHQERDTLDRALGEFERIIGADQYNSVAHY